jgi:hypothetical protein
MGAEGNVDHSQVTEITLLSPLGQPWVFFFWESNNIAFDIFTYLWTPACLPRTVYLIKV